MMITFVLQFFTTKNSKFLAKNTIFDFSCKFTLNSIFLFNMFESRGVKRQTSVVTPKIYGSSKVHLLKTSNEVQGLTASYSSVIN